MVYQLYIARELTPLHGFPIEEQARTAALAKELMIREYNHHLVDEIFSDNEDGNHVETIADIYSIDGGLVIVRTEDFGIFARNESKLKIIKDDLETRLRYFKLDKIE